MINPGGGKPHALQPDSRGGRQAENYHISGQLETQYNKTKTPIRVLQIIGKSGPYQGGQLSCPGTPTVTSNQVQLQNHLLLIKTRSNTSD